jgi:hypothetical protein
LMNCPLFAILMQYVVYFEHGRHEKHEKGYKNHIFVFFVPSVFNITPNEIRLFFAVFQ